MAATDVKDIFLKTETSGEVWLYKRLCNGTEIAVLRVCCDDNPGDPGNTPDPPIAAEICRVANGMSVQLQTWIERLAQLMTEQPNNQFGDYAAASAWSLELYGLLGEPGPIAEIVASYSADETDIYTGTQDAAFLQLLVCAVYRAIVADANGINLSPETAGNIAVILAELEPDPPDAEVSLAVAFGAALMPHFRLATLKRWAYDASIVDPGTVTDLECDACGDDPEGGICVQESYVWQLVDATPSGWSTMTTLPTVDFGNLQDDFEGCPSLSAERTAFGDWIRTASGSGVQCMGIRRVFAEPCLVLSAACTYMADTGNTKALAIVANVDGTWTVLTQFFDQAPAANPRTIQARGEWHDVSEIVFIHRNGNGSLDIHPRITETFINFE